MLFDGEDTSRMSCWVSKSLSAVSWCAQQEEARRRERRLVESGGCLFFMAATSTPQSMEEEGGAIAVGGKRSDGGKSLPVCWSTSFMDRERDASSDERMDLHLDFLPRLTTS